MVSARRHIKRRLHRQFPQLRQRRPMRSKPDEKLTETPLTAMGKRLNGAVLEASDASIKICIPLIGIMALWLGLLNVAKDAGLIDVFARLRSPFHALAVSRSARWPPGTRRDAHELFRQYVGPG